MNLVNELQVSAEQDDVLTVLRKTKRLASKLGRQDISEWLQHEMEGYPNGNSVPDYRKVSATVAYNTNGPIPVGFGKLMNGIVDIPFPNVPPMPIPDEISTINKWIEDMAKGQGIYHSVEGTPVASTIREIVQFHPLVSDQISLMLHLNSGQVRSIPERIKDRVLDWACKLEEAGVTGENMTFSAHEKQVAHSITFNINNSQIEQLNNMGSNRKG